jgi:hypothetical protein
MLPGAAASGGLVHFTRVHTYKSGHFADVATSQWYAPYVQTVYEYGLMNGKSDAVFAPDEELTIGEAVKLAASLHRIYSAGVADFAGTRSKTASSHRNTPITTQRRRVQNL